MRTIYPEYRTQIDSYAPGVFTWTMPADAAFIHVTCIGGGGGGGSGARGAAGTHRNGGQGGQGGAFNTGFFPAALLTPTVAGRVGGVGMGGPATSYDDGYGTQGVEGGVSYFGEYVIALGGNGGAPGTDAPFNVDDMPHNYAFVQSLYARTFGGVNGDKAESAVGCPGGGSGGHITAANAPVVGADGSRSYGSGPIVNPPQVLPGANGTDSTGLVPGPGWSGGGGSPPGAAIDPDAVNPEVWPVDGGHGGRYGAGGAGGSGSTNGADSGIGGNGGIGVVVVVSFF